MEAEWQRQVFAMRDKCRDNKIMSDALAHEVERIKAQSIKGASIARLLTRTERLSISKSGEIYR